MPYRVVWKPDVLHLWMGLVISNNLNYWQHIKNIVWKIMNAYRLGNFSLLDITLIARTLLFKHLGSSGLKQVMFWWVLS